MTDYQCPLCASWRATPGQCQQIACRACGTVQCHRHGLSRGTCHSCYYGRLPGWSFNHHPTICQYQGCTQEAVYAYLPGNRTDCCLEHGRMILERQAVRRRKEIIP